MSSLTSLSCFIIGNFWLPTYLCILFKYTCLRSPLPWITVVTTITTNVSIIAIMKHISVLCSQTSVAVYNICIQEANKIFKGYILGSIHSRNYIFIKRTLSPSQLFNRVHSDPDATYITTDERQFQTKLNSLRSLYDHLRVGEPRAPPRRYYEFRIPLLTS